MDDDIAMSVKMSFGLIAGVVYAIFGAIQVAVGFGYSAEWVKAMYVPPDIVGGLILILIGAVLLRGFRNAGVAYIYVGILLALVFMAIYLLMMGAEALEAYVIGNLRAPIHDMRPGIYLGILPLAGLLAWRKSLGLSRT